MRKPPPEIFPEAVFYEIVSVFPSLRKVLVPSTVRNVSMFLSLRAFNSSSSAGSLSGTGISKKYAECRLPYSRFPVVLLLPHLP